MIEPKAASVSTVEAEDELPEVTEEYVASLSEEVRPIAIAQPSIITYISTGQEGARRQAESSG